VQTFAVYNASIYPCGNRPLGLLAGAGLAYLKKKSGAYFIGRKLVGKGRMV
jgi:hypothetical protein